MTQTTSPQPPALRRRLRAALRVEADRAEPSARLAHAIVVASTLVVALFLAHAVTAWRPHEDEVLELFTGRGSLADLVDTVFHRGGAPLHFLLAWVVVHLGGGLTALRALSAVFACASVPVVAALVDRLAGRTAAMVATPLLAASWTLLFHGVYARMYSLFLLTSALSYLALVRATERDRNGDWALWGLAATATIASHTYGAIVLASQALYVLVARPVPLRRAAPPFLVIGIIGIPFWWIDLVLAGRYDIGVGGGGARLGGPGDVIRYFFHAAGDFTVGRRWPVWIVLAAAAVGIWTLVRTRRQTALLIGSVIVLPFVVFAGAKVGSSASPETRHLIFALPFVLTALAVGLIRLARPAAVLVLAVAVIATLEVQWAWNRTPEMFRSEPAVRVQAREAAAAWLAAGSRSNDVLFGYDPLFLGALEAGGASSRTVVPRADAVLALKALEEAPKPLGRGIFVFDASDTNNVTQKLSIPALSPLPRSAFEVRAWGPFLVVRTTEPTRTVRGYLERAREAELLGKSLLMGDADVNYATVAAALADLDG